MQSKKMERLNSFDLNPPGIKVFGDIQIKEKQNELSLKFSWEDLTNCIQFSSGKSKGRSSDLWQTTCFEVFFQAQGKSNYFEINLSSSGSWQAYEFFEYRNPQPPIQTKKIELLSFKNENQILEAVFFLVEEGQSWNCSLAAVIELTNKSKLYFALKHAGKKPDFHLQESFILRRSSL